MDWKNTTILVTGGTGSFGQKFLELVNPEYAPRKLIVFSRDEYKQFEMRKRFDPNTHTNIRYFIGDIRDKDRLYRAFDGVDIVVHAAALKQVPAMEYNPIEAIKTNVIGAANIVDAAVDRNVKKVIALSTDKAVNPINLYGATKLCHEKLFIQANNYSGRLHGTRFSVARYGNVVGSRGSVIPFFLEQRKHGMLPITDDRMTRFWVTLEHSVRFVVSAIEQMEGGEIFVPKLPSANILDVARAVGPECEHKVVGIRPGEKLHELLVSPDESLTSVSLPDRYVIFSRHDEYSEMNWEQRLDSYCERMGATRCETGFTYSSGTNEDWITVEGIRELIAKQVQT